MPRITELTPGVSMTPTLELDTVVYVVQTGASRKLPLSDMLAARQPLNAALTGLAAGIPPTGDGALTRIAGVWSVNPNPGLGLYDLAGTAATKVSNHNADVGAHGGVQAAFASHTGVGGSTHPVATLLAAGFAPIRSGAAFEYLSGLGTYLPVGTPTVRIAEGTLLASIKTYYIVSLTTGNATINLPAITAAMDGLPILVKARSLGGFSVTIQAFDAGDGTDKIDNSNTLVMTTDLSIWTLTACYDAGGDSFWSRT